MTTLEAFLMLRSRPIESRADVFDIEVSLHGEDYWPEAATAAVSLAGFLDDAKTDGDLDEALRHFQMIHSAEIPAVETEAWFREIAEVIEAVCREIESRDAALILVAT